jgi:hypothetical protein
MSFFFSVWQIIHEEEPKEAHQATRSREQQYSLQ